MKVHLIKEKTVRNFVVENPGSKAPFEDWMSRLKMADWEEAGDIQLHSRLPIC